MKQEEEELRDLLKDRSGKTVDLYKALWGVIKGKNCSNLDALSAFSMSLITLVRTSPEPHRILKAIFVSTKEALDLQLEREGKNGNS